MTEDLDHRRFARLRELCAARGILIRRYGEAWLLEGAGVRVLVSSLRRVGEGGPESPRASTRGRTRFDPGRRTSSLRRLAPRRPGLSWRRGAVCLPVTRSDAIWLAASWEAVLNQFKTDCPHHNPTNIRTWCRAQGYEWAAHLLASPSAPLLLRVE